MASILLLKYAAFKQITDQNWGFILMQLDSDDDFLHELEMQVLCVL